MINLSSLKDWREAVNQVVCGDALDLLRMIPDKAVDLVLTDIPYNISREGNGLRELNYGEWDKQSGKELEWINAIIRVVKQSAIVFCGKRQFGIIENLFFEKGFMTRPLIWHKPNPTVINCDCLYIEATELAVYAKLPGALFNPTYKHNVFNCASPPNQTRFHPTQKPLNLFKEFILDCSNEGDLVLDPMAGSFTTAVACKELGRRFIGCEISEAYAKIGEKRLAQGVMDFGARP